MTIAALDPGPRWDSKKCEISEWVQAERDNRTSPYAPEHVRCAFTLLMEMLESNPPAGEEAVVLQALYETLRNQDYLTVPAKSCYRVEGGIGNLKVRFTPGDVRAYLNNRIDWLGARADEGNHVAGHYRDAVQQIRKALFGGE